MPPHPEGQNDGDPNVVSAPLVSRRQILIAGALLLLSILSYYLVPGVRGWVSTAIDVLARGDIEHVRDYLLGFGVWAPVVSGILMVFQAVVAPLPAFVVTFANGLLFGWGWGALLSWSGAMVGAAIFRRYGDRAVLIARLLPFVSFDLISYGAGLTPMSFWRFFLATGIGQLPATIVYSYLGQNLTGSVRVLFFIFVFMAVVIVVGLTLRPYFLARLRKRGENSRAPEEPEQRVTTGSGKRSVIRPFRRLRRLSGDSSAIGTLFRLAVSAVVLVAVFVEVPLSQVAAQIRGLDPIWIILAFATVYAAIVLSAYKWRLLLRVRGHPLGIRRLTRHYFVGLFFNNFLPTSVGGDVVRAWDTGRDLDDAPAGAASVISERLIAALGLGLTAAIGLPFVDVGPQAYIAVAAVVGAAVGLMAVFLAPSRSETLVRRMMGDRFEGVTDWVTRVVRGVDETIHAPRAVAAVLLLSIGFQILVALVNYWLFRALGSPVGLGESIVFSSVISAATLVPVTISGHGVREAGYAYFFGLAGVPADVAVAGSLLFFIVVALSTLPGAPLFVWGRR